MTKLIGQYPSLTSIQKQLGICKVLTTDLSGWLL